MLNILIRFKHTLFELLSVYLIRIEWHFLMYCVAIFFPKSANLYLLFSHFSPPGPYFKVQAVWWRGWGKVVRMPIMGPRIVLKTCKIGTLSFESLWNKGRYYMDIFRIKCLHPSMRFRLHIYVRILDNAYLTRCNSNQWCRDLCWMSYHSTKPHFSSLPYFIQKAALLPF